MHRVVRAGVCPPRWCPRALVQHSGRVHVQHIGRWCMVGLRVWFAERSWAYQLAVVCHLAVHRLGSMWKSRTARAVPVQQICRVQQDCRQLE